VDLPDMIAYRQEHLANVTPVCIHEHVVADLTDREARAVLARVEGGRGSAMVITEGLLVYLTSELVRALADQLHEVRTMRWWLTDLGTPLLLKMLRRNWQSHLTAANAPMQFAPAEGTSFFEPSGWREAEFRSVWLESQRLGRTMPLSWLWNVLSRLRSRKTREAYQRMSGIVLLERG